MQIRKSRRRRENNLICGRESGISKHLSSLQNSSVILTPVNDDGIPHELYRVTRHLDSYIMLQSIWRVPLACLRSN